MWFHSSNNWIGCLWYCNWWYFHVHFPLNKCWNMKRSQFHKCIFCQCYFLIWNIWKSYCFWLYCCLLLRMHRFQLSCSCIHCNSQCRWSCSQSLSHPLHLCRLEWNNQDSRLCSLHRSSSFAMLMQKHLQWVL